MRNDGPSDARDVVLTDTLPGPLTWASGDAGCTATGQVVTCAVGTVPAGTATTRTIRAVVSPSYDGQLSNTVRAVSSTPDPDSDDLVDTEPTTVIPRADLATTKRADRIDVTSGQDVTYTLTMTNNGPGVARAPVVEDTLPAELAFQSVTPGSPTCVVTGQDVRCTLADVAPGATATVRVVARALGDAPVSTPGTADHHLTIGKVEQQTTLSPGETRDATISCPDGGVLTDGAVRVDHVDQDTGGLTDVDVRVAEGTSRTDFAARVVNLTTGQTQVKLFGTCLGAATTSTDGHSHAINTRDRITHTAVLPVGRTEIELPTPSRTVAAQPGIAFADGAKGRLVASEPTATGRRYVVDLEQPGTVRLSQLPLDLRTSRVDGHSHRIQIREVVRTVTLAPGVSDHEVACGEQEKGIVASYDLPAGVVLLGHDPRPKIRNFRLLNTGDTPVDVTIDLMCVGDRVGGAEDVLEVTNVATVASVTPDPDAANNTSPEIVELICAPDGCPPDDAPAPQPATPSAEAPSFGAPAEEPAAPSAETAPAPRAEARRDARPTATATTVVVRGSTAAIRVACPATCAGRIELTRPGTGRVLAQRAFRLGAGDSRSVRVTLSRVARAALRKNGNRKVRVVVRSAAGARSVTVPMRFK